MIDGIFKKKAFSLLVAALMLIFLLTGNALANLIANGSFEDGSGPGTNSFVTVHSGDSDITGWTVGGDGVDWHSNVELKSPQNGAYLVDLNLNGPSKTNTLSQTFATEVNAKYTLTFWLAAPNRGNSVNVNIAGSDTLFSQAASSNADLTWGEKTLTFAAIAPTTTLTFSNLEETGYYWGPLLDNVSVAKVSSVPLPSALLLLGSGLLGLTGIRRKINK